MSILDPSKGHRFSPVYQKNEQHFYLLANWNRFSTPEEARNISLEFCQFHFGDAGVKPTGKYVTERVPFRYRNIDGYRPYRRLNTFIEGIPFILRKIGHVCT